MVHRRRVEIHTLCYEDSWFRRHSQTGRSFAMTMLIPRWFCLSFTFGWFTQSLLVCFRHLVPRLPGFLRFAIAKALTARVDVYSYLDCRFSQMTES